MDMKQDNSAMQCVNCPGATDHSTADCPMGRGLTDKQLIELIYDDFMPIDGGYACDMYPEWVAPALRKVIAADRALLTAQPQASVCETMGRPKAECGCPDCGSSLIEWPQASAAQNQCGECGFPNGAGPHCGYHGAAQSAPVENDAFGPGSLADLLFQLGEKGVGVSGGTHGDRWRVSLPQTVAAQSAPAGEREDEREAFEAVVRLNWASAPLHYVRDALPKDDPRYGQYVDETLQGMWVGWQGRAAWQRTQSAVVPEGERLADLLESVWMGDDEAKPHGIGATYWNNAVIACKVAIRDALAAAPAQPAAQELCNCPAGSKPEPHKHAPNCPYRTGAAAQDQGEVQRLREALMSCAKAKSAAEVGLIVDAALAASTGQEVK